MLFLPLLLSWLLNYHSTDFWHQQKVSASLSDVAAGDTTIIITAISGLQFDIVRFAVKPNTNVKIILENGDDMAHNWVLTQPGKRLDVVNAALALGDKGPKLDYVPRTALVLSYVPVLDPDQQKEITFKAPAKEGVYPYACTYPGHGFVMYGAMYVTTKSMPSLKNDPNIPPQRAVEEPAPRTATYSDPRPSPHPYPRELPMLYRTFMPESGPASIVVMLPNEQSYCWDAGACRLRYAWRGYVDNAEHWRGNGKKISKVVGDTYFRDQAGFPLRFGTATQMPQQVKFKGYRIINRYPQFWYSADGVEVRETIKAVPSGNGLVREFQIHEAKSPVFFQTNSQDGMDYSASVGEFRDGVLRLEPGQAHHFIITMKAKKAEKL